MGIQLSVRFPPVARLWEVQWHYIFPVALFSQAYGVWIDFERYNDNTGEGNGNPLQYSCLENPMDRGAWQATVHGVTECLN